MTPKGSHLIHILTATSILLAWRLSGPRRNYTTPLAEDLNFTEMVDKYGYVSTEHTVVTEDGYILKVFRMEGKICVDKAKNKTPVILSHGLLQSADVWLDAGPDAGLAYLLADACYDLWISNIRGNYYGRRHKHFDTEDARFWDFSIEEIGSFDVPAVVDYVIERTRVGKVNYIGFSQGAGTFYVMCSERPGFCDKINVSISLAPASRQINTKSMPFKTTAALFDKLSGVLSTLGYKEVFPKGTVTPKFLDFLCFMPIVSSYFCSLISFVDSEHPGSITNHTTSVLYKHFPAGTSLKNMMRYSQSFQNSDFVKFDYGSKENLKLYGTANPPAYNLSAVTAPVVVIYGRNDHLVDVEDVKWLIKKLPNVVESFEVADPLWNHFDVTYSQYISELIFPKINHYLAHYS